MKRPALLTLGAALAAIGTALWVGSAPSDVEPDPAQQATSGQEARSRDRASATATAPDDNGVAEADGVVLDAATSRPVAGAAIYLFEDVSAGRGRTITFSSRGGGVRTLAVSPEAEAVIRAQRDRGLPPGQALRSDRRGRFEAPPGLGGNLGVCIARGYAPMWTRPNDQGVLEFRLERGSEFVGRIHSAPPDGAPVPKQVLALLTPDGSNSTVVAQEGDGAFLATLRGSVAVPVVVDPEWILDTRPGTIEPGVRAQVTLGRSRPVEYKVAPGLAVDSWGVSVESNGTLMRHDVGRGAESLPRRLLAEPPTVGGLLGGDGELRVWGRGIEPSLTSISPLSSEEPVVVHLRRRDRPTLSGQLATTSEEEGEVIILRYRAALWDPKELVTVAAAKTRRGRFDFWIPQGEYVVWGRTDANPDGVCVRTSVPRDQGLTLSLMDRSDAVVRVSSRGVPLSSAPVRAVSARGRRREEWTDQHGKAVFKSLDPGSVVFSVLKRPPRSPRARPLVSREVHLVASQATAIELAVDGGELGGGLETRRLALTGGHSPRGWRVRDAYRRRERWEEVDASGEFRMHPGSTRLELVAPSGERWRVVSSGSPRDPVELPIHEGVLVVSLVAHDTGRPLPGIQVWARQVEEVFEATGGVSDEAGVVRVPVEAKRRHVLRFLGSAEGYGDAVEFAMRDAAVAGENSVTLRLPTFRDGRVSNRKTTAARGRVRMEDGSKLPGDIFLKILAKESATPSGEWVWELPRSKTVVQGDGDYEVEVPMTGEYICILHLRHGQDMRRFEFFWSGHVSRDFELK